eukprot:6798134-Karenia_brevis.AAC.1
MITPTPKECRCPYPPWQPPPCLPIGVYISHGPEPQRHTQTMRKGSRVLSQPVKSAVERRLMLTDPGP